MGRSVPKLQFEQIVLFMEPKRLKPFCTVLLYVYDIVKLQLSKCTNLIKPTTGN